MRYRIDPGVESFDEGRVVLGGDPSRLLRLSDGGARLVARWRAEGVDRAGLGDAAATLLDRLAAASMAHPVPGRATAGGGDDFLDRLVVVVPVRDRPDELRRCLVALAASGTRRIVVVDDGSADVDAHRSVAAEVGAVVVERPTSGGPAAARMSGWSTVHPSGSASPPVDAVSRVDFVAFVDSDVVVSPTWWLDPAEVLGDERVGLVAPRVVHAGTAGLVDRYEASASPLDLGADPAPIRPGTRVSYVPAAALVVRAEAFAAVRGFDPTLDVGEDVDLVWRLVDAGWTCRYVPTSVVHHVGRSELGAFLRRRVDYGRSAAALERRHPGRLAPARGSRWSWGVAVLLLTGHPVAAAALVAANVASLARSLERVPDAGRIARRLVLRGHVGMVRQAARAAVRPWWPVTALLAALPVGRSVRRRLAVAALAGPVWSWLERRPDVAPLPWIALSLADDAAYATGVWLGCRSEGTAGPLLPST